MGARKNLFSLTALTGISVAGFLLSGNESKAHPFGTICGDHSYSGFTKMTDIFVKLNNNTPFQVGFLPDGAHSDTSSGTPSILYPSVSNEKATITNKSLTAISILNNRVTTKVTSSGTDRCADSPLGKTITGPTLKFGANPAGASMGTLELEIPINDNGSIAPAGIEIEESTVITSEANTYRGETTIKEFGTLILAEPAGTKKVGSINDSSKVTIDHGGKIVFQGKTTRFVKSLYGTSGASIDIPGPARIEIGASNSPVDLFNGSITGIGGITKVGTGILTLGGANSYTDFTYIKEGTLTVKGTLSDQTDVFTDPGAVYNVEKSDTIASLSGTGGTTYIKHGQTLTTGGFKLFPNYDGIISGGGGLSINGNGYPLRLTAANTYTGNTTILQGGHLALDGSITSETTVNPGATLSGTGTISGTVYNYGTVSPGNSIGTLTIDGDYGQLSIPGSTPASLNIEVNGSTSDLLKITGDNRTVLLGGNLTIGSLPNTHITPNQIYTAIDITGQNAKGGEYKLNTDLSGVVGSSGYLFARETSPAFATIDQSYYDTCTSKDPNIQKNCTKLQFAWLQVAKDHKTTQGTKQVTTPTGTVAVVAPTTTQSPTTVINQVKVTGGAITTASSGNTNTNTNTCTANTGNAAACQQQNQAGTGKSGSNSNNIQVAKVIDAGQASLGVAVTNGTTGGDPVTVNGVDSGYTTNQTKEAQVTPDFVSVYNALFSIPNRQQLNQALHSITAEPYASMQSVALEALEQFRANTLALTAGRRLPFYAQEQVCKDGTTNANNPNQTNANQNSDASAPCDTVTRQKLTPWSLLIDGSNTQATLNGTNDLASLDYNIFSSSYGLQYDFNRNWSAGAAFGYGRANLYNYEYSNARINSDTYSGAAWGIYRPTDAWKLTALAGYMNLQYDSSRNINFGGLDRNAVANWSGNGFTSALAAQYDWVLSSDKASRSAVRIKPNTFFSYALHHQGAFSETGAQSLNLALDSHTADSLIYGIGFSIESPIITGKTSRLIPKLYVGYEYDFNGDSNEEHQLSSSFAEVPALGSFDVLGQNRGANAVDVALALEFETSDTLSLYSNVGGAFWSNGNELNYGAGLRLRWK